MNERDRVERENADYAAAYQRARAADFKTEPVLWSLSPAQWGIAINTGLRRWTRLFEPPVVPGVTHSVSSWWREGSGIAVRCACGEVRRYDAEQVALMALEGLIQ